MSPNVYLNSYSTLKEWLSYLEKMHFKPIDLNLARVKLVGEQLNLLQQPSTFVITVAGTNGKGTTCHLLEKILINAGLNVGVFSSPHLVRYNERVKINEHVLSDEAHTRAFHFIEQNRTQSLTYFEFSLLAALYLFKQANLAVLILEVGLGGRLDATNIIDNDISVITSIDIDHVEFLGNNRNQIGLEKAGIFRAHKPVIIGDPDVPHSVINHAQQLHCPLFCRDIDWQFTQSENGWEWSNIDGQLKKLPLSKIPLANAATVLATLPLIPFTIKEQNIRNSLAKIELAGRFQIINPALLINLAHKINSTAHSLATLIIDVGHNPHAARYLAQQLGNLKQKDEQRKIIAVCGFLQDKDAMGIFSPLLTIIDHWHCVSIKGSRGQTGEQLSLILQQAAIFYNNDVQRKPLSFQTHDDLIMAVKQALTYAKQQDIVIVFGSFYIAGELLEYLSA